MPSGGRRPGSGRKKGSLTLRSREIAIRQADTGIMPLDVMLKAMNEHYNSGRYDEAAKAAKDAAPYCHPRLNAIEVTGKDDGPVEVKHQTDFNALRAKWRDRVKPPSDV